MEFYDKDRSELPDNLAIQNQVSTKSLELRYQQARLRYCI